MLNCLYSLVFNVSTAGLYQKIKLKLFFTLLSLSVHNSQMFSMFLISFLTFTQFNYGATPWRHLALLLTALALTAPVCAVVTSLRERLV